VANGCCEAANGKLLYDSPVLRGLLRVARYAWASPNTLVGLVFVPIALLPPFGQRRSRWRRLGAPPAVRVVDGVLEVHGPWIAALLRRAVPIEGGALAMTFGHIVIARDAEAMEVSRAHERVHVRQCERGGPLFIPAYLTASVWAWSRGRGAYEGNVFEIEAYRS
jgi:hypothetical protein